MTPVNQCLLAQKRSSKVELAQLNYICGDSFGKIDSQTVNKDWKEIGSGVYFGCTSKYLALSILEIIPERVFPASPFRLAIIP